MAKEENRKEEARISEQLSEHIPNDPKSLLDIIPYIVTNTLNILPGWGTII
jgi:hypothetical protein